MKNILFVNACVRPESRTYDLAKAVLSHLDGEVQTVDLNTARIPVLDGDALEQRNAHLKRGELNAPMLSYANQFALADTIVIAAPYWDLMFPALLKIYFEAITVSGVTFRYNEHGIPVSLCQAKRLIYVTTAGGPIGEYDFGFQYVNAIARGFFGIPDVHCIKAEGLDIIGADVKAILDDAKTTAAALLR